jgi:hypothetical protein
VDELGRDVLSALPGEPVAAWTGDRQLIQVARLLRAFHDAAADFVPPSACHWRVAARPGAGGCHRPPGRRALEPARE